MRTPNKVGNLEIKAYHYPVVIGFAPPHTPTLSLCVQHKLDDLLPQRRFRTHQAQCHNVHGSNSETLHLPWIQRVEIVHSRQLRLKVGVHQIHCRCTRKPNCKLQLAHFLHSLRSYNQQGVGICIYTVALQGGKPDSHLPNW